MHYESKLCIMCIVTGICNRPKSDILRNPQHCYFSLIFCAVLDSPTNDLNTVPLKILKLLKASANYKWNPQIISGNRILLAVSILYKYTNIVKPLNLYLLVTQLFRKMYHQIIKQKNCHHDLISLSTHLK